MLQKLRTEDVDKRGQNPNLNAIL